MLECVIIDDEEFSINALKTYINQVQQISNVTSYTCPQTAMNKLLIGDPVDLLFLDVDMPLISGIELAPAIRSKVKKLVFTTAHSKYAFDAFEVEADAFLLKPFSFAKFSLTLSRLFPAGQNEVRANEFFLVKNKEEDLRIVKVNYADVVAFESLQNYVKIYLINDKSITAYLSIKDVLELVRGRLNFRQLHRAFVISTDHINYIEGNNIRMSNQITFNVGETFKEQFAQFLSHNLITTARKKP